MIHGEYGSVTVDQCKFQNCDNGVGVVTEQVLHSRRQKSVFACKILCLMGLRISERFTFLYIGPISVPRFRTMYLKTAGSGLAESEVMKLHIPDR
mgnify:CR=1 FL=1